MQLNLHDWLVKCKKCGWHNSTANLGFNKEEYYCPRCGCIFIFPDQVKSKSMESKTALALGLGIALSAPMQEPLKGEMRGRDIRENPDKLKGKTNEDTDC